MKLQNVLFTLFFTTTIFSQTKFDEMKMQYDDYRNEEQQDSALAVAKRMNEWALKIEKDTSLHYAVSFKYIGNSFLALQVNDSAIFYYKRSLTQLEFQKRKAHPDYVISLNKLGILYSDTGDYKAAEPYFKQAIEIRKKSLGEEHPDYTNSLDNLGSLYSNRGNYRDAEPYFKKALEIRKKFLGEEHPDYVSSLNNLGFFYKTLGDYKAAELYYKQALEIREKSSEEDDPNYASSIDNLGNLYSEMGYYKAAEPYYKQALDIRKKLLGEEHPDYTNSIDNLGLIYYEMGDYKAAEPYYKIALEIRKRSLDKEDPNYASFLNNLAIFYTDMGDYNAAELYCKQALEIRKKSLGEEHPDYASSLNCLGNIYFDKCDYKTAESYFKTALEIRKKYLGEDNPDFASSIENFGILYKTLSDYKTAEAYFKQALEIRKKSLGEEHPDYAISLNNLGSLYSDMGYYKAAEPYFKQALEIRKKTLGEEHRDYASSLNNLGSLYSEVGYYKAAEPYYKQALDIRKKLLGEEHPDYISSVENHGILYSNMGNYKSAEQYYKQALDIRKKLLGEEHPDYASSLNHVGLFYITLGDYNAAEPYFKQALNIRKKSLGEEHPDFASTLNNIGLMYYNIEDYKVAEPYYNQALEIIKKSLGEEHPNYSSCLNNLGSLYSEMGDYKAAEPYYKKALDIRKKLLGEEHPDAIFLDNLGILYYNMGDYKAAQPYLKQALDIRKKSLGAEHPDYASSLYNLGSLYSNMGDFKSAEPYYNNCFIISNNFINTNFEWLTDRQIELFWKQYKGFYNSIDQFSIQYVEDFPEISGLSYNSNIITKGKLLEAKLTKDNAIASPNYNSEVETLYNQLTVIRKKMAKIEDSDSANQYKKLDAEANDLDSKLSRLWSDYAQQKKNLSITWKQVQENLSNDEAAIEFVRYKAEKDSLYHYNALIIRKTDVNPILVKLCTEKQLQKINPKEGFSSFYPLVWAPLEEYIKNIKTIYYSPIGLLNTIPFSALYSKKGEGEVATFDKISKQKITTSEPKANFLMNRYTLHQLTSTRYLAMGLKDKAIKKVEKSITLVGGVNYDYLPGDKIDSLKKEQIASRDANSTSALPYLKGTKIEVETINKTLKLNDWDTALIGYNDATEENIEKLENQNAKGVLHIATHGFAFENATGTSATIDHASIKYNLSYNPDPMKRCGLIFAGGNWAWIGSDEFTKRNPDAEDGILTGAQVALLNLKKTKLVVLSACETGLGKIEGGEGVFGLKRAFKLAGVDQIIVSLWEVPDQETMQLMTLFYEDLAKTQNAIVSFEKAQKEMCKRYPTQPDLWAGFVLVR